MHRISARLGGAITASLGVVLTALLTHHAYTFRHLPLHTGLEAAPLAASLSVVVAGVVIARGGIVSEPFVGRTLLWMAAGIVAIGGMNTWIVAEVHLLVPVDGWYDPVREFLSVVPFGVLLGLIVGIYDAGRLDQQRDIRRLNRINETLRITTQELVDKTDRDALEQAVCDRLTESAPYDAVWVGRYDPDAAVVTPSASAGFDDGYIESFEVTTDETELGKGPGGRAIKTREPQWVSNVYADPTMEPWWDVLEDQDVESLAVIPITHGETIYGFFSIYADRPNVFDAREREVLSELGDSVGHAIASIEARERLARRERELARQNERLEEFAGVVSHDLRSPLNVAEGYLDLARESGDDAHFDRVEAALVRMNDLIDDLLALARQGEAVDEVEPVPLRDVVERAWSTAGTPAATLRIADDLGVVACDRSRLRQLLENLFRNAITHAANEDDAADLTVTVGRLDEGFYVADDGSGVPAGERERVFDIGYTTADGGTGFGLNIVRQIADAHGWSVTLTTSEGGGARFEFDGVEMREST
ncbi:signal transduction histidine kinase [Halarchaeum solikamskense]|uniref:receiver/sensor box histidine kinase n=1 Tax=Halarchaeum nitratireducens TaxID=489913 RepID=UPI001FD93DE8|nr:HAMP domain-containing sensor histidine kinase [Halarchaeum solikamskense]MBP2250474.1 signal transduction histidine kinase [Halarchaeum solikamskense]